MELEVPNSFTSRTPQNLPDKLLIINQFCFIITIFYMLFHCGINPIILETLPSSCHSLLIFETVLPRNVLCFSCKVNLLHSLFPTQFHPLPYLFFVIGEIHKGKPRNEGKERREERGMKEGRGEADGEEGTEGKKACGRGRKGAREQRRGKREQREKEEEKRMEGEGESTKFGGEGRRMTTLNFCMSSLYYVQNRDQLPYHSVCDNRLC